MSAERFVAAARGFVERGAKWRHQRRRPDCVDCLGLVVLSLGYAGYHKQVEDPPRYGRRSWNDSLRKGMVNEFGQPVIDWRPGDIALFRKPKSDANHVGVLGDYLHGGLSLIHCEAPKACEHRLAGETLNSILCVFRPNWSES